MNISQFYKEITESQTSRIRVQDISEVSIYVLKIQEEETEEKKSKYDQKSIISSKNQLVDEALSAIKRRAKYSWKFTDLLYNASGIFKFLFCCIKKKNPFNIK